MIRKFCIVSLCLLGMSSYAQQKDPANYGVMDDEAPQGLAVGQTAPEIVLIDQYGKNFSLYEQLEEGPVVITFYRGNWCPHCSKFLSELIRNLNEIEARGANVIAISPESEAQLVRTNDELIGGKIVLLSDVDNSIMKAYDVDFKVTNDYQARLDKNMNIDLKEHNTQEVAELPVAATYLVDQDGKIVYRHFDLDYTKRADINELLRALEKLN